MQSDSPPVFDGTENLLSCLDIINVWTSLKCFEGEKKALALASRLEGAAFENYRRLENEGNKQSFDVIAALLEKQLRNVAIDSRLSCAAEKETVPRSSSAVCTRHWKFGTDSVYIV